MREKFERQPKLRTFLEDTHNMKIFLFNFFFLEDSLEDTTIKEKIRKERNFRLRTLWFTPLRAFGERTLSMKGLSNSWVWEEVHNIKGI